MRKPEPEHLVVFSKGATGGNICGTVPSVSATSASRALPRAALRSVCATGSPKVGRPRFSAGWQSASTSESEDSETTSPLSSTGGFLALGLRATCCK
mmetsp:Transcript_102386/g.285225  ORF Transcript_102386/g.285225 Transcript_102386/m.285225 type:complete len:97 (+) Transcript_102386:207-497(+)